MEAMVEKKEAAEPEITVAAMTDVLHLRSCHEPNPEQTGPEKSPAIQVQHASKTAGCTQASRAAGLQAPATEMVANVVSTCLDEFMMKLQNMEPMLTSRTSVVEDVACTNTALRVDNGCLSRENASARCVGNC